MANVEKSTPTLSATSLSVQNLFGSNEISEGITALKGVNTWLQEGKSPPYRDESATLYLQFTPKYYNYRKTIARKVTLVHPLSFKRKVCFIGKRLDEGNLTEPALLTHILQEIGIRGKIKMIPRSQVETAVELKAQESLNELAQLYDTYITDEFITTPLLILALQRFGKYLVKVDLSDRRIGLEDALAVSIVIPTPSKDGFMFKVGHTGLSDAQIEENIRGTVDQLCRTSKGLQASVDIHLKTGRSDGKLLYAGLNIAPAAAVAKPLEEAVTDHSIPELKISEALLALGADSIWPEKGTKKTPAYDNHSATICLRVTPIKFAAGPSHLTLKHTLSYNRRVCYIAKDMTPDVALEITQGLKRIGVKGKIRMIPFSQVKEASKDWRALRKLTKLYDTYLTGKIPTCPALISGLSRERKRLIAVKRADLKKSLLKAMGEIPVFPTGNKRALIFSVGHTGLSYAQVKENILTAMKQLEASGDFPGGLWAFSAVHVVCQSSHFVPLYEDISYTAPKEDSWGKEMSHQSKAKLKAEADALKRIFFLKTNPSKDELQAEAGLAVLKRVVNWPAIKRIAGKVLLPSFTDKTAKFFLQLECPPDYPPIKCPPGYSWPYGPLWKRVAVNLPLPHPLSYKRRVCLLVKNENNWQQRPNASMVESERDLALKEFVKDIGVQGITKILLESDASSLFNHYEMNHLADMYDTHLVDSSISPAAYRRLSESALEREKIVIPVNFRAPDLKTEFEEALATSLLMWDPSKRAFEMTIAHTALTEAQILENIRGALTEVCVHEAFPQGMEHFRRVLLRIGDSKSAAIYVNNDPTPALETGEAPGHEFMPKLDTMEGKRKQEQPEQTFQQKRRKLVDQVGNSTQKAANTNGKESKLRAWIDSETRYAGCKGEEEKEKKKKGKEKEKEKKKETWKRRRRGNLIQLASRIVCRNDRS